MTNYDGWKLDYTDGPEVEFEPEAEPVVWELIPANPESLCDAGFITEAELAALEIHQQPEPIAEPVPAPATPPATLPGYSYSPIASEDW